MKTFLLLLTVLLLAGNAMAEVNYNIAKEQAKRAAGQASGQSDATQPQPPGSSAPQAPPTDPALAATLKNIADLRADLAVLSKAGDAVAAADQRIPLLNHLSAAAQGTKAATASVRKLADALIAAVSGKKMTPDQQAKLARDLHALFNGAHLSASQQQTLLDDAEKILTEAGVTAEQADKLVDDLKAVATETQ